MDGNNFRKIVREVADDVGGKKVRNAARSNCKSYLSDRSYVYKRNLKKVEKALKY